jgi:Histidine kinase-, DNA gyrase B-, and HSP90-like ATPase
MERHLDRSALPRSGGDPAGHPAPARDSRRTLALVATEGVAYLVYWLVILILVGLAATSFANPPEGNVLVGAQAAIILLAWAVFCLAVGVRRGRTPSGRDRPPPVWLPLLTSIGCGSCLAILRLHSGLPGPWASELLVALLVVGSMTVWAGPVAGAVSTVTLAVLVVLVPAVTAHVPGQLSTPLAAAVPGIGLLAAGFAVSLAVRALRRSALQYEATLDVRDEMLVRERTVAMSAHLAAEVERSLHDTALNTLETIAAHGDHLDPQVVADRCRADGEVLARWSGSVRTSDLAALATRLVEHARVLGLALDVEISRPVHQPEPTRSWRPGRGPDPRTPADGAVGVDIPGPVLNALDGAAREALTNVAKHSGVHTATLSLRHEPDGVEVIVTDAGIGVQEQPDRSDGGYGLTSSVAGRMVAAGGAARIGPGPDGRGTQVVLDWWQAPDTGGPAGPPLLVLAAEVMAAVGLVLASIAAAFVMLGWAGYELPVAAMLSALLPIGVTFWLVERRRESVPITASHVIVVCATYAAVGAASVIADPFCSTLLGENAVLDARVPMLAVLLLVAPRVGVLLAVVGTVLVGNLASALAWSEQWPACGATTAGASVYITAALVAAWLFIRRVTGLTGQFDDARAQAAEAQVRIGAQMSVRAEQEAWVITTLASAQALLADLASGARDPGSPAVRAECAAEAQFLRGLLAVGRAPDRTRRPARLWLILLRVVGCPVSVRGDFSRCDPPPETVRQIDAVIDAICTHARGSAVTLVTFDEPATGSLTVSANGPAVSDHSGALAERLAVVAPEPWSDIDEDSLAVEWIWEHPVRPVASTD